MSTAAGFADSANGGSDYAIEGIHHHHHERGVLWGLSRARNPRSALPLISSPCT
jgi:hypothetical protein